MLVELGRLQVRIDLGQDPKRVLVDTEHYHPHNPPKNLKQVGRYYILPVGLTEFKDSEGQEIRFQIVPPNHLLMAGPHQGSVLYSIPELDMNVIPEAEEDTRRDVWTMLVEDDEEKLFVAPRSPEWNTFKTKVSSRARGLFRKWFG